jgi:hypothetical protein
VQTTKINRVDRAADLMRKGGTLLQMHTRWGLRWFISPGGECTPDVAHKLLERPDVQPSNDGLFPGISQTFKICSRAPGAST